MKLAMDLVGYVMLIAGVEVLTTVAFIIYFFRETEIEMDQFAKDMEGVDALVTDKTIDESPSAYKNIFEVMALQTEMVEVVAHVVPMLNIKG